MPRSMPKYRVDISGANFLIDIAGRTAKYGFFTTRFVESADSIDAQNSAVQLIRETQRLRDLVRNALDDPPFMDVTSISELESFDGIENLEPGFVWYEERPKRWWQIWRR
jgi:acetolactate synthase regulatory subunit